MKKILIYGEDGLEREVQVYLDDKMNIRQDLSSDCTVLAISIKPVKIFGRGSQELLILGAGGHGKVIADLATKIDCYQNISFLDDDTALEKEGIVIGTSRFPLEHKEKYDVIIAIGNPRIREKIQHEYEQNGISLVTLIHPAAVLPHRRIQIGKGSVIMAGAIIQEGVEIGKGVIINTAASIDHDCKIGDYVHISVGSHLAGNVIVGTGSWVGIGAIINNNVNICDHVIIGAGAVVVKDITESGTYIGVPATKIRDNF